MLCGGVFTLMLVVCPSLSTASCDGTAGLLGEDETSLIQTKITHKFSTNRSAKGRRLEDEEAQDKVDHAPSGMHVRALSLHPASAVALPPSPEGKANSGNSKPLATASLVLESEEEQDEAIVSRVVSAQVPFDVTLDVPQMPVSALVDGPFQGYIPSLSSRPKRMATANLALMSVNLPGDFVETGVYYGSTFMLMAKVVQKFNRGQRLWAADSFAGLPNEDPRETARDMVPGTAGTASRSGHPGDYAASREVFESNLEANGLGNSTTNPQIQVLQGFFNETLPSAPIQQIAFLRLDGDIYVSTMDALTSLYDKVSPGGYVYVDDYGSYMGCHHAVDDFRSQHGITDAMYQVSEGGAQFDAVWWKKGSIR